MSRPAVFLDRDGVINANVFNPLTAAFESPHHPEDFRLRPNVLPAIRRLAAAGWPRLLVSNQPSYAKAKVSLTSLQSVAQHCDALFVEAGLPFTESLYCYHHPDGVVPGFSGACHCRKPSPGLLFLASERHGIDLSRSWMVGDRATDVCCGRAAGTRTILLDPDHPGASVAACEPDAYATDLAEAVDLILSG